MIIPIFTHIRFIFTNNERYILQICYVPYPNQNMHTATIFELEHASQNYTCCAINDIAIQILRILDENENPRLNSSNFYWMQQFFLTI